MLEDGAWLEAVEGQELEELLVGSDRWSDLVSDVGGAVPEGLGVIHVMDREADDYGLWTHIQAQGDGFVIRAQHDRRLEALNEKLFAALEDEAFVVSREVVLSRRGQRRLPGTRKTHPTRDRRPARLAIRAGLVEIRRPDGLAPFGSPTMLVSVVEVVEVDPPDDATAIHWLLLSTLPVSEPDQACRVVDIYRKRWLIEEFFKALKTGCAAEKRQGKSLWSLLNTITLLVPVAWRLLVLRTLARLEPNAPAHRVLDGVELRALRELIPKAKLPRHPTTGQVMLAIARLGGHLKSNGEPGWLVLGRGLEELLTVVVGWRMAMRLAARQEELEM